MPTKHTPGPCSETSHAFLGHGGFNFCPHCGVPVRDSERAHLIAAAPELLEACKEALSMMDSLDDADVRCTSGFGYVETALFNAIEKAEGKPCAA